MLKNLCKLKGTINFMISEKFYWSVISNSSRYSHCVVIKSCWSLYKVMQLMMVIKWLLSFLGISLHKRPLRDTMNNFNKDKCQFCKHSFELVDNNEKFSELGRNHNIMYDINFRFFPFCINTILPSKLVDFFVKYST